MGRHDSSLVTRARNELFQHVIRCRVLDASMPDRQEWMDETMSYIATRYPLLSDLQLAQLDVIGRRFISPVIPHGASTTAVNRSEWQQN